MSEILVRADVLVSLPGVPPVIAKYSSLAVEQSGLTIGSFLARLEDFELDDIFSRIERDRHHQEAFMPWVLFAILLANGEGMPVPETFPVSQLVRKLVWLVQAEMLRREGLVELNLQQLSLETFDMSQVRTRSIPVPKGQSESGVSSQLKMQSLPLRQSFHKKTKTDSACAIQVLQYQSINSRIFFAASVTLRVDGRCPRPGDLRRRQSQRRGFWQPLSCILMPVSNSHREALEALFGPAPVAPAQPDELIVIPENLDSSIEADAQAAWDYETFRWYRGVDANNVTRVFRFQRGLSLAAWQELLRTQHLVQVHGPFRAQAHALR